MQSQHYPRTPLARCWDCNRRSACHAVLIAPSTHALAGFSPDDKFSKERVICKKRFGLLPTQQPEYQF